MSAGRTTGAEVQVAHPAGGLRLQLSAPQAAYFLATAYSATLDGGVTSLCCSTARSSRKWPSVGRRGGAPLVGHHLQ